MWPSTIVVDGVVHPEGTGAMPVSLSTPWYHESQRSFVPLGFDFGSSRILLGCPVGVEKSSGQTVQVALLSFDRRFVPRTPLGKRLAALRAEAIASGMKLLSQDEVLQEVKRRRGELTDEEDLR